MANWRIFIIRVVLGIVFAIFASRLFFPNASLTFTVSLCLVLVALAYLSEYLRQRKKKR